MHLSLFKDVLEFNKVILHTDINKENMIEALNSLKEYSDKFEDTSGDKDILLVAIVNVGFHLDIASWQPH